MAKVNDVAAYIMAKCGPMTAMKLQKLAYYSYAWHLVWEERRLFDARIEAWANGPVIRELYNQHRGMFQLQGWKSGDPQGLSEDERSSVDAVLGYYGQMTAHQLSELTHQEQPWRAARGAAPSGASSDSVIDDYVMFEYYDGLTDQP